jgi:ThiF family/Prokaryotic E2 family A/Prokaryotic homologs of the JAB domain
MIPGNHLTAGQQQALDELREVEEADPAALEILEVQPPTSWCWLQILISIETADVIPDSKTASTGPRADIRARERFTITVPPNFPFVPPQVSVPHDRFAGLPHVQWQHHLCLYVSPTTEWQPSDGMFGLLDRLLLWVERAALGELDPAGEPLHPPVAYQSMHADVVVIKADTPPIQDVAWVGFAVLQQVSDTRVDLVGWLSLEESRRFLAAPTTETLVALTGISVRVATVRLALAILLARPTAFEFPTKARELIDMLNGQGIDKELMLDGFALVAALKQRLAVLQEAGTEQGVYVVIGTPMRGVAGGEQRYHLVVWRLSALEQQAVDLLGNVFSQRAELASIGERARGWLDQWLDSADLDWARVYDDRPEVTTRRDRGSPLESVKGRRVLLVGCGAIGGHIAEHLVRAGVGYIMLVDKGQVSPGVLVRQPYNDTDIGLSKVDALADRLHRIRPGIDVAKWAGDILTLSPENDTWPLDMDLIIDAAANPAVTAWLERWRKGHADTSPPIVSFLLGHTACRGIATIAPTGYSGGGVDLLRKVKFAMLAEPGLRVFAEDFFPDPPRTNHFQPEPGCSEATFVGSDAEVAALTAMLLLHALKTCARTSASGPSGSAVLADLGISDSPAATCQFSWLADKVIQDEATGLHIRLSPSALSEMRAECRLMGRRCGPQVETGGLLFGEIDDASGVVWVTLALGPPPDSCASKQAFVCGVEGVEEQVRWQDKTTRGAARFLGLWHSHPGGIAAPSDIDEEGMHELLVPVEHAPRRALLLIIGGTSECWMAWLNTRAGEDATLPQVYARLCSRPGQLKSTTTSGSKRYARAMASSDENEARCWPSSGRRKHSHRRQWKWFRWRWFRGA